MHLSQPSAVVIIMPSSQTAARTPLLAVNRIQTARIARRLVAAGSTKSARLHGRQPLQAVPSTASEPTQPMAQSVVVVRILLLPVRPIPPCPADYKTPQTLTTVLPRAVAP